MESERVSIEHLGWSGCGFYVRREAADHQKPDYLHNDGVWRKSTCRVIDGKKVFTGYFSTRQEAESAYDASRSAELPIAA